MIKTQIQIPEELYKRAKEVAKEREMSFAEVTRRGLEYITSVYPRLADEPWEMPLIKGRGDKTVTDDEIRQAIQDLREPRL
jgi:hypothetical protein